ncbi:oligosaccharide flippase family protein [[Clostridium] spiroforme]|nr:oligosaccharide flippase family protein [Thomasclavelia spiroformis]
MKRKVRIKLKEIYDSIISNGILKNSFITLSSQTIAGGLSFLATLIIIRDIGTTGNGIIAIVTSYATLFNGLFNFQSYNALIKYGAEAIEKKDDYLYKMYIKTALIQDVITAIIAFIVGKCALNWCANIMGWNNEMLLYINIFLITILINITGSLNAILRLNDKFHITGLVAIISNVVKLVLIFIAYILHLQIYYYVLIEIIQIFVQNVLRLYYTVQCFKENNMSFMDILKTKLYLDYAFTKFNIYNNLVSAVDIPAGQAVNLIINKLLGINAVGVYNLFVKAGGIIAQVTDAIGQAIFPEFSIMVARNNIAYVLNICKKMLKTINLISIIIAVFSVLLYKIWMPFLMDVNFNYALAFAIYVLFLGFSGSLIPLHQFFVSVNLVHYNLYIAIICNILYIILLIVLGNLFDLIGIMIAMLLQSLLVCGCKIIILKDKEYWI